MDKGITRLCRLSALGLIRIYSNWGLWWELKEDFKISFVDGWVLEDDIVTI